MAKGTYKREFPRGEVVRGWDPMSPSTLTTALPVAIEESTGSQYEILAGMLISPDSYGSKWIQGVEAGSGKPGLVAVAQDDAADWNVSDAKSLVGLSCSGDFEFATPFFVRTSCDAAGAVGANTPNNYKIGTLLTYARNDEYTVYSLIQDGVLKTKHRSASGYIRPAKAGEAVIGVVSRSFSGFNAGYTSNGGALGARPLQGSIGTAVSSSAERHNSYMVYWTSSFAPSAPTA